MESGHRLFFDRTFHGGNMMALGNGDSLFRGPRSLAMNMEETLKKRPFFSSPDELFDDEYYDDQSSEKKRRLTVEQVHMLEKSFETENKLEPERKSQLAKNLGLQPRQVAVWFQNRRARWKTKQLERDFDMLKSSYESLLSDYEARRKETDKLKDEVVSLTKKLQPKEHVLVPLEQTPDPLPTDLSRPSSDSTGVVDEVDGPQQQLVDSGDSYFPNHGCDLGLSGEDDGSIGVVDDENSYFRNHDGAYPVGDMGLSGEDDCSDDGGRIYFSEAYMAASEQHHEDEEEGYSFGWWVWS